MQKEKSFMGIEHLTLRSLIIGAIGSGVITAGSMYVALKLGMVPWPTVFAAIVSMGVLKLLRNTSKHEINVSQTAMTAGSMIAAGIGFTLPGLWKTGHQITIGSYFWIFLCVSFIGLLMGLFLTWIWRKMLLTKENLPFPIGIATAETIESGDKGGIKAVLLAISLGLSAIYTVIRDWFMKIPSYISFKFLSKFNIETGIMMSPLAPAIGYMVGPVYTLVLFIGAILAYVLLVPIGINIGLFDSIEAATSARQAIGLGLMIGSGLGVIIKFAIDIIKKIKNREKKDKIKFKFNIKRSRIALIIYAIAFVLCIIAGLSPLISILILIALFFTTLMSSLITGQTGIDPLEIFGILVMIIIRAIIPNISIQTSLLIAATVAITSGFVGDTMFDYKTGQIFNTNPKAQLIAQAVGGIVGAIVASFTIFIMIDTYGPVFSDTLPAPQASFVFGMVEGSFNPALFWGAAAIGAILYVLKVPSTTLGIGLYLPFGFSLSIFIGGIMRFVMDKFFKKHSDKGTAISAGLFGGESFTGVVIAFISLMLA